MKKHLSQVIFLTIGLALGFLAGHTGSLSAYALQQDACVDIEAMTDVNATLKCLVKLELENSGKLDTLVTRQQARFQPVTIQEFLDSSEPAPEPIELTGTGPSVVDIDKGNYPAIAMIEGGSSASLFSVVAHDANSDLPNSLVTALSTYKGIRPLDVEPGSLTIRLEIEAKGDWAITILPVTAAEVLTVPGTYEGEGDTVLILEGTADTATITGGVDGSLFSVVGHGGSFPDSMVTALEPYEGKVVIEPETVLLEIVAPGEWSITVE
jgi:hypothetical protein